ncbi:MAG TPA: tRNA lysidine(34) synthetase TilS, partial [Rhodanobacter sp.]|nr:tRNA lysidine(34) synthetase TilS [Rhodanobacter sp.]
RSRGLRALHVDHGLQPPSVAWARHCAHFCTTLAIPCTVLPVQVRPGDGDGLEAAARDARYTALAAQLGAGEWLVLAHHRDDQAETVLLKLLRGAGPEGLGGMRELRAFGRGQLWRPLLALPRQQLLDYVATWQLPSIDDPSNRDTQLARNLLRHDILPRLLQHWPQAVHSIVHSAALSRAAADALQTQWLAALDGLRDPASDSLEVAGWLALGPALRDPLLDHWLHGRGLRAPTTAQRRQIEQQSRAGSDQVPRICWPGTELRIWKGRLWAMTPRHLPPPDWQATWHGEPLRLADGGTLALQPEEARLATPLTLRLRRGGERIKPLGDAHTRDLRDLFQQARLPPWQRVSCPLLYLGDELVAVADRWISARGAAAFTQAKARPCWHPAA